MIPALVVLFLLLLGAAIVAWSVRLADDRAAASLRVEASRARTSAADAPLKAEPPLAAKAPDNPFAHLDAGVRAEARG